MPTHLAEPWLIVPSKKSDDLFIVQADHDGWRGQRIARLWNVMRSGGVPDNKTREANAARIVDCVNVLAGTEKPAEAMMLVRQALQLAMASGDVDAMATARQAWRALGGD